MPFWLLALVAAGILGVGYSALSGAPTRDSTIPRAPSGKAWPPGVTTATAQHAVEIALVVETHPETLRAFANVLEGYDPVSSARLFQKAGGR